VAINREKGRRGTSAFSPADGLSVRTADAKASQTAEKARNGPQSGPHARNLEVGGCGGRVEAVYDPPEGGERDAEPGRSL